MAVLRISDLNPNHTQNPLPSIKAAQIKNLVQSLQLSRIPYPLPSFFLFPRLRVTTMGREEKAKLT